MVLLPYSIVVGMAGPATETSLLKVLLQLVIVITVARLFGILFRRLGQPAAVGEIAAGLILGPSVLGKAEAAGWLPAVSAHIFDASVAPVFAVLSQLGLILLLFVVGLEFDFSHLRRCGRAAASISFAGIVLPFALGMGLAYAIQAYLPDATGGWGFWLFMGTAMSITALPILGRIMIELKISRTRVGAITITAAAVDDVLGWILLATVSALVGARFEMGRTLWMLVMTAAFTALMVVAVRPLMLRWIRRAVRADAQGLAPNAMAVVLVALFLCAIATNLIGIFAIFGAFLLGAVLSDQQHFREAVTRSLSGFVTAFFLPIFFTYTGLRTDIGSLDSPALWLMAGAVFAVAVIGKFGGCALAAWASGLGRRNALCIGVMMNTRALMELVVINVGYDLKVIPESVFCMLVMMALATTVMTTPVLLRAIRGTELEEPVAQSGFIRLRPLIPSPTEATVC